MPLFVLVTIHLLFEENIVYCFRDYCWSKFCLLFLWKRNVVFTANCLLIKVQITWCILIFTRNLSQIWTEKKSACTDAGSHVNRYCSIHIIHLLCILSILICWWLNEVSNLSSWNTLLHLKQCTVKPLKGAQNPFFS